MDNIPPFVIHKAPEIDTAWKSAVAKFNKPAASAKVTQKTNAFKQFISTYVRKTNDPVVQKFDVKRKFTWAEVQKEADEAVDEYNQQGRSWRHPLRSAGRSFSNNASSIEILLQFIPDGEYTFIICGALTLIFNAAKRMKAVREKILGCLSSLSELVPGTKAYVQVYEQDRKLWQTAEALYIGILESVQGMTEWLDGSAYKKTFQIIFQQEAYGKQIDEKIRTNIEERVAVFRERVEFCLHLRAKNIETTVVSSHQSIETLVNMLEGVVKDREWQKQQNEELRQLIQVSRAPSPRQYVVLAQAAPQPSQPFIDAGQLQYLLQVSSTTIARDLDVALCEGQSMSCERQTRAAVLMQDGQFQSWLKSGSSTTLFVNGMESLGDQDLFSPMTYFVGLLSQTLQRMGVAVPLTFLCGQHATPGDLLEGPRGMLRAMISQVLLAYGNSLDLSFINYSFLEAVVAQDMRALCELFRGLMTSVKQGTFFCLLDGVSWFETSARIQDLSSAMVFLRDLAYEIDAQGGPLILKILLTSPMASQHAAKWFPRTAVLTMQEEIEGDDYSVGKLQIMEAAEQF